VSAVKVSVVICTHNPRARYVSRVLDALKAQTLPRGDWELLLIDNASAEPLAGRYDLSWHPAGRHIREDELGLTPARLRGIAEGLGDVIVFVDDDNVLTPDYLAEAVRIGEAFPFLGAWGGVIEVEFETPPAPWVLNYLSHFAYREFAAPRWSNIKSDQDSQPYGAGMCLRRDVCRTYARNAGSDLFRRALDRRGTDLLAGGDLDLVLTAADLDLGWGNFPSLRMVHLIPPARTEETYMLRLREKVTMSNAIIASLNGCAQQVSPAWRHHLHRVWRRLHYGRHAALFMDAERRGLLRGFAAARSYVSGGTVKADLP
jgi:glycosyltransferase involved in cell wall biosynthesis